MSSVLLSSGVPIDARLVPRTHKGARNDACSDDDEATLAALDAGSNALVMSSRKKKNLKRKAMTIPELPATRFERRMSKSKERKLANVEVCFARG